MLEAVGKQGSPLSPGVGLEGCGYLEELDRGHGLAMGDLSKG